MQDDKTIGTVHFSAIVVRFLTGRYLSEYASIEEVTYERNVTVDEKQVSIKITDVAGKVCQNIYQINNT